MLDTSLRKKRAAGLVILAVLLVLFLAFNRLPKLDTVRGDLEVVSAVEVECFQGFCIEDEPDSTLLERWWGFSATYMRLVAVGMAFAFLVAGLTESFLFPRSGGPGYSWGGPIKGGLKGLAVGPIWNLCSPASSLCRPPLLEEEPDLRGPSQLLRGLPLSISRPWSWRRLSSRPWWEAAG